MATIQAPAAWSTLETKITQITVQYLGGAPVRVCFLGEARDTQGVVRASISLVYDVVAGTMATPGGQTIFQVPPDQVSMLGGVGTFLQGLFDEGVAAGGDAVLYQP